MNTIELNLDYANASRLLLPTSESVSIALVGCGGTGSWLTPSVARVARLLVERGKNVDVYFIDPDRVEAKNVYRQNFCQAEIGCNKAETLAFRYGLAWGVDIVAIPEPVNENQIRGLGQSSRLVIYIGCVDNWRARQRINHLVKNNYQRETRSWWIDCGNSKASGQVVVGCGSGKPPDPYKLPGFCTWLPLPSDRHPDLVEEQPEEKRVDPDNLSCAEMALIDAQGLAINQNIAGIAADYLVRLLVTHDLRRWGSYIDVESGSMRSKYIVPENVSVETPT